MTASTPPSNSRAAESLTFAIDGMSCGHCVAAVTNALATVPAVRIDRVAVGSASVTVASPDATDSRQTAGIIINAIGTAGFTARVVEPAPPPSA